MGFSPVHFVFFRLNLTMSISRSTPKSPWSNSPAALARTTNGKLCVTTHIECGVFAAHATARIRGKKQKGDEGGIDEISVPTLSYIYSGVKRDNDGDT